MLHGSSILLPDLERLAQSYLYPVERWCLGLQSGFPCRVDALRTACREGLTTEILLLLRRVQLRNNHGLVRDPNTVAVMEAVASGNMRVLALVLGLDPRLADGELQRKCKKAVITTCDTDLRATCLFVAGWRGDWSMIHMIHPHDSYEIAMVVAGAMSAGRIDVAKELLESPLPDEHQTRELVMEALCVPVATHVDPFGTPWAQEHLTVYDGMSLCPPRALALEHRKALLHGLWPIHHAWIKRQPLAGEADIEAAEQYTMNKMLAAAVRAKDAGLASWLLEWFPIEYIDFGTWRNAIELDQCSVLDELYARDSDLAWQNLFFSIAVRHHSLGCLKWLCTTYPTHPWQPHDTNGYRGRLTTWAHLVADTWTEGPMPAAMQNTVQWLQEKGLLDPNVDLFPVPRYPSFVCLHGRIHPHTTCFPYYGPPVLFSAT